MKIAVLNYITSSVDIIIVDKSYVEENYDGDIEEYLIQDFHYSMSNIDWMEIKNGITISDNDSVNQIL